MTRAELAVEAKAQDREGTDPGWYVYAVMDGDARGALEKKLPGGVSLVQAQGLLAAISKVPDAIRRATIASAPNEVAPRASVEVLATIEDAARTHEEIVEHLMRAVGSLLPLRLGTAVRSPDDVLRILSANAGSLVAQLATVSGRREWGVRVRWARQALVDAAASDDAFDARGARPAPGPGRGYLAMRQRERTMTSALVRLCQERATTIERALRSLGPVKCSASAATWAAMVRGEQDNGGASDAVEVLQGSVLLKRPDEDQLAAVVEEAIAPANAGLSASISGPWPPYSFVQALELSG